jgi:micrococcal nuclease
MKRLPRLARVQWPKPIHRVGISRFAIVAVLAIIGIGGFFVGRYTAPHEMPVSDSVSIATVNSATASNGDGIDNNIDATTKTDTGSKNDKGSLYKVTSVIDGDTIHVDYNGTDEKVRFIGVDTPETVDPKKPVECYGKEASNWEKNKLSGQSVYLVSDPTQDDKDKYGRLLRYVYLGDEFINLELIKDGYGREYTYDTAYKFQSEFKSAQSAAESGKVGLWGACQ